MSGAHKLLSCFASAYWYPPQGPPSRSLATFLSALPSIHLCHREGQSQRLGLLRQASCSSPARPPVLQISPSSSPRPDGSGVSMISVPGGILPSQYVVSDFGPTRFGDDPPWAVPPVPGRSEPKSERRRATQIVRRRLRRWRIPSKRARNWHISPPLPGMNHSIREPILDF